MKNAKTVDNKKKFNGKIAGLTTLEILFYILSVPVIVVLAAVFGVEAYQLVPYYSFWPFVGVILAGVLCLVFVIVVMCITLRKKSKRSILMQTVSIIIAVVILTSFIAVALDVALPDILAQLTSSTLFYEDMSNASLAAEQTEFNAALDRKFIMLNLLNGNYDPQYYYETLKTDSDVVARARKIRLEELSKITSMQQYEQNYLSDELYAELFQFIYDEYIMTDMEYALLNPNKQFESGEYLGNTTRLGMGHAIAEAVYDEYKALVKEGMSNERIQYLFEHNYASLKNDGYLTYDDSMILYATSGRMTVPVVIRLLLDTNYTYTEGQQAYIKNGEVVEPEGTYFLELYKPEEVIAIMAVAGAVEWNDAKDRGVLVKEVEVVEYGVGAVIIPSYNEDGDLIGGYIRAPRKWSILDMDGKNMDVAAIEGVVVDLGSLLGGILSSLDQTIVDLISDILHPMTLGDLLGKLNQILPILFNEGLYDLADSLLQGITDVIMTATGGSGLFLNLAVNDQGALEISIAPTNVEVGMHGYQYMTWMESNSLLFAVMGVMSLREWLYIFGAVSVLLAFAAGMCREIKARVKKDIADNEELALETAGAGEENVAADVAEESATFVADETPASPVDTQSEPFADAPEEDAPTEESDSEAGSEE